MEHPGWASSRPLVGSGEIRLPGRASGLARLPPLRLLAVACWFAPARPTHGRPVRAPSEPSPLPIREKALILRVSGNTLNSSVGRPWLYPTQTGVICPEEHQDVYDNIYSQYSS